MTLGDSVILSDTRFINAAKTLMQSRCDEFERAQSGRPGGASPETVPQPDPPVQAAEGQKVYLLFDGRDARDVLPCLEETQATFLLTAEDLSDGDLVRSLVAQGHAVALRMQSETPSEAEAELQAGREALWQAACIWLELIWYDGGADLSPLLDSQGLVRVRAEVDGADETSADLLRAIGQYREDVAVYWGGGDRPEELEQTLDTLVEARYHLSAWRLTA